MRSNVEWVIDSGLLTAWENDTEEAVIPEGVTTIGKGVFRNNNLIRSVVFPNSLRTIGDEAFAGCAALERVTLTEGIRRLGNGCFMDCAALRAVALPETVTSIHANAFAGCSSLSEIALPDGLRRNIEARTFAGCAALRRAVIPAGVRQIKPGAFANCAALDNVEFGNPEIVIYPTAFDGCGGLSEQTLEFIEAHRIQDDTVNVYSRAKGAAGRLSNYTPRRFFFDGVACNSIEGVLQSLKCPDPEVQREICRLTGGSAKRAGEQYDWRKDQALHWQGRAYPRQSEAYRALLDRLYDAAFEQDAAFRADLAALSERRLDHREGLTDPSETVLTRSEFVRQLRRLADRTKDETEK